MGLRESKSDPKTVHIQFLLFQKQYGDKTSTARFVLENKYQKLTTIYYLLFITKPEGLPMEELIEFLKELMKSEEPAKGNVFPSKFNILFH